MTRMSKSDHIAALLKSFLWVLSGLLCLFLSVAAGLAQQCLNAMQAKDSVADTLAKNMECVKS